MKELLKKKGVRIGLLVIILLVAMGIIGTNVQSAQRREEYNGHIEAAEKYLSDLDYEQAIAEYKLALEIDPKSEEVLGGLEQTYLAYAKSYADTGDYERAIDILEEGYAVTERESLKEQIEEYKQIEESGGQQTTGTETETDAEGETEAEEESEAAQSEEIKQLVESDEFQSNLGELWSIFGGSQFIADEKVRELCWPMIEALERYRALYPENGGYYEALPILYYLVGEYDLSLQLVNEWRALFPDNPNFFSSTYENGNGNGNGENIRDEYGRLTQSTHFYPDGGKQVEEYEYGQNGKMIRSIGMNDTGRRGTAIVIGRWTSEYEYDSEGRLSKITNLSESEGSPRSMTTVTTFEYSEGGYIEYTDSEGINDMGDHDADRITRKYVIDEYGRNEMVGEPEWQENE